ncbi:MAG: hypothetical protein ABSE55_13040 [Terracidiphilus sp.]
MTQPLVLLLGAAVLDVVDIFGEIELQLDNGSSSDGGSIRRSRATVVTQRYRTALRVGRNPVQVESALR